MKRKYGFYASRVSGLSGARKKRKVYARTSGLAPGATRGFFNRAPSLSRAPERKLIDTSGAISFISDTTSPPLPNVVLVNGVSQGSDINNRIGRRYTNVSVQMRYTCQVSAITPTPAAARIMIVYDLQPNGATTVPILTDILQTATTTSPMNINNRDRFRVIYDKTHTVSPNGPEIFYTKMFKKLNLVTTNNAGTTATIGSIATGAMYVVTVGDTAEAADTFASGIVYVRVRFTDE